MSDRILIVGGGTMGLGIAQVAAQAGYLVHVVDAEPEAAASRWQTQNLAQARKRLDQGKLSEEAMGHLEQVTLSALEAIAGASFDLAIEAIVEDLAVKQQVLGKLSEQCTLCYLATNTSSLSVTEISRGLPEPGRFFGLHFFNPAPVMALVEIVAHEGTHQDALAYAEAFCKQVGKTYVHVQDSPGFIVNRVARGYYAEAIHLHEQLGLEPALIDEAMRAVGFRAGPFELMDLIGHDVNLAVTTSVWRALGSPPRFAPSASQTALVDKGALGKKSGQGYYTY